MPEPEIPKPFKIQPMIVVPEEGDPASLKKRAYIVLCIDDRSFSGHMWSTQAKAEQELWHRNGDFRRGWHARGAAMKGEP